MTRPQEISSPVDHRPIYLWAGPGTIRMNRLKFMNAPVDEPVHLSAHEAQDAKVVVEQAGCNVIYLTYNWGFPPEVEEEDWQSFQTAVKHYQSAGAKVFGYIQTSNCVVDGSFKEKDWYALTPKGKPVFYYTGRHMTCWNHPEWQAQLHKMITGIIASGADGVFFDNPWYGSQPLHLAGTWFGSAGCYCPRCQELYLKDTGEPIPTSIQMDSAGIQYLRWRANQAAQVLADLAAFARSIKPDVLVSVNNFDAVMRNSHLIYGIDLQAVAGFQDVMMIEDYGLPGYQDHLPARLTNNALTVRTARALCGQTPISVDPYDHGIGFDQVYPSRRFQQAIAEAAALGASNVVKGTEFVDEQGCFTLLTAAKYDDERKAIGRYNSWIAEHRQLFQQSRTNLARVALLHPGDQLWQRWDELAPLFFGAGQALLASGIPFQVVMNGAIPEQIDTLLTFTPQSESPTQKVNPVRGDRLPGWSLPEQKKSPAILHKALEWGLLSAYSLYFSSRIARSLLDAAGVMKLFTGSPLFNIPDGDRINTLVSQLPPTAPIVRSAAPVLIEVWQAGDETQIHLMNYSHAPQTVQVLLDRPRSGECLSPDHEDSLSVEGEVIEIALDIYAILRLRK